MSARGPLAHPVLGWIVDFAVLDLMNFLTHWFAHKNPLLGPISGTTMAGEEGAAQASAFLW